MRYRPLSPKPPHGALFQELQHAGGSIRSDFWAKVFGEVKGEEKTWEGWGKKKKTWEGWGKFEGLKPVN